MLRLQAQMENNKDHKQFKSQELGKYSQNMLSEAFWTPNIGMSWFDEYPKLGSWSKSLPS